MMYVQQGEENRTAEAAVTGIDSVLDLATTSLPAIRCKLRRQRVLARTISIVMLAGDR